MTPSPGTTLPTSDPFDDVRRAFVQWLQSGGKADVVRVRTDRGVVRYSVDSILGILGYSDELLTPYEWRLLQEWLLRNDAWEWSAAKGRVIPPLTFRLASRTIRAARTKEPSA